MSEPTQIQPPNPDARTQAIRDQDRFRWWCGKINAGHHVQIPVQGGSVGTNPAEYAFADYCPECLVRKALVTRDDKLDELQAELATLRATCETLEQERDTLLHDIGRLVAPMSTEAVRAVNADVNRIVKVLEEPDWVARAEAAEATCATLTQELSASCAKDGCQINNIRPEDLLGYIQGEQKAAAALRDLRAKVEGMATIKHGSAVPYSDTQWVPLTDVLALLPADGEE